MKLSRGMFGRYQANKRTKQSYVIGISLFLALAISITFTVTTDQQWDNVVGSRFTGFIAEIFQFWKVSGSQWLEIIYNLFITFLIAIIITLLSLFIAFPISIFGARNLYNGYIANTIKIIASVFRSVPTIIWAIIFIPIFGLTSTTAIIAMTFHSVAFFIKTFSESFEEVDNGVIEALSSTGANKLKVAIRAIVPESSKKLISWIALRMEINLAVVIVVAPAIGVPDNLGYLITTYHRSRLFAQLGATFILLIIMTVWLEKFSRKLKTDKVVL